MALGIPQDVEVRCVQHGLMHFRFPHDWWDCRGFDGENCDNKLTMEDLYEVLSEVETNLELVRVTVKSENEIFTEWSGWT